MLSAKTGTLQLRDQLRDYQFRGHALQDTNFLLFMMNTYETFDITENDYSEVGKESENAK